MKKLSLIALALLIVFPALSQFNTGSLSSANFHTEIPFEYEHNKIVIEASFNGVKGRYLVDTGAMCILFKDSTHAKTYPFIQEMNVGDASGKKQKAEIVRMPSIQVGDLVYKDIPTLYVDMFPGPFKCLGYDGIIGSNLLRFGAFKIDWETSKMIIADTYQSLGEEKINSSKMHVNKTQSSPFVKVEVNGKGVKWVLLDTGSGDSFSLETATANWLKRKAILDAPLYVSSGTNSHGAWGAGEYSTSIYKITTKIGKVIFNNAIIESGEGKSKVGMDVFELGDFIFDYPQKRFFFSVDKADPKLTIQSFGIDLIMENDTFVVNGLWDNTLAAQSDISKGDVVLDVEGLDFSKLTPCEVFTSMKDFAENKDELTFLYRKPDGTETREVTLKRIVF